MGSSFALWDMVTANLVADFETETDALSYIRGVIADGQRDLVEEWALGWDGEDGGGAQIAAGLELAELARSQATS